MLSDFNLKTWIIIILSVFVVLVLVLFLMNGLSNQNSNQLNIQPTVQPPAKNLDQNAFSSCQTATRVTPFGQGSYIITVFGVEKGVCHWQFSLQFPQSNQTKDCNYPLTQMSNNAFSHLFGQDKTSTGQCLSDICKQQDSLQQTYCK